MLVNALQIHIFYLSEHLPALDEIRRHFQTFLVAADGRVGALSRDLALGHRKVGPNDENHLKEEEKNLVFIFSITILILMYIGSCLMGSLWDREKLKPIIKCFKVK